MKIDIRFRGLERSSALRDHALRRIHAHLSRFGSEVSAILVRVADVNGPRGGLDKRCQVTVRGPRFGAASLHHLSDDAYAATALAVERVSQAVGRALARARGGQRGAPSLRRRASASS